MKSKVILKTFIQHSKTTGYDINELVIIAENLIITKYRGFYVKNVSQTSTD